MLKYKYVPSQNKSHEISCHGISVTKRERVKRIAIRTIISATGICYSGRLGIRFVDPAYRFTRRAFNSHS